MNHTFTRNAAFILAAVLVFAAVGFGGSASAATSIYVNDGNNVLGMDIKSAYAVGGNGSSSIVGDSYVLTGNGTVKIGDNSSGEIGDVTEAPVSGTVAAKNNTVKIGLYYKTASWDNALTTASLENKVGSGYMFGYYDNSRVFHELARTGQRAITMKPTGSGREVSVYISNTNTVIYTHTNSSYNLAIRPISNSGKAETWFKQRTYYGDFEYSRVSGDRLAVINVLNVEDYVKGVVPYEMGNNWPLETLKAGAIAARNYVKYSMGKYNSYGFDIVNTHSDQVYSGTLDATAVTDAACEATANQYMTYNGSLCCAFYYAANGGASENSENVFLNALGYCRAKQDPFESKIDFYCKNWSKSFTTAEISQKLSSYNLSTIRSVNPEYTEAGNVYSVNVTDVNGKNYTFSKSGCLTFLTKLGFQYTSMQFKIDYNPQADTYTITGGGAGHNVGMSQWGAYSMGKLGYNYRQILGFYYTGVAISTGV